MAVKRILITAVLAFGLVCCGAMSLVWYNSHAKDNGNSHLSKNDVATHGAIRPGMARPNQKLMATHGAIRPGMMHPNQNLLATHGAIRPGVMDPDTHGAIRPGVKNLSA